jgi:hypothetical protein
VLNAGNEKKKKKKSEHHPYGRYSDLVLLFSLCTLSHFSIFGNCLEERTLGSATFLPKLGTPKACFP